MTDRELLEAAAKAAGLWDAREQCIDIPWNPLFDDGDALRLAVKLGLEVYHSINNDRWSVFVGYPKDQRIVYVFDEWGDDECAATRRAIVRAAASLGGKTE